MGELTYILGAGASYESIPVVKTFNKRLLTFKDYLVMNSTNNSPEYRSKLSDASNYILQLHNDFLSHQSFDTYFKKLFHVNDIPLINQGKRLLHLYFLWEHSQSSLKRTDGETKDNFCKQALFDRRYDALIAGLLEPISGESMTVCKVNFITWNYDINLLNAIKIFFYPKLIYSDFLKKIQKNEFVWEIDGRIKIINVNGYFYSSQFNDCQNLRDAAIDSVITDKIYQGYHASTDADADANLVRFAWEQKKDDRNSMAKNIKKVISGSENIVIIGYTFPLYNRLIDLNYMDESLQNNIIERAKFITVQDPNSTNIANTIEELFGNRYKLETLIKVKNDCDYFYIPSNIYSDIGAR
jgi:hypothetical protein